MPWPAALLCLARRGERYRSWHADPAIATRTSFFAAAAIVNQVLARHALLSAFLLELGATLESVNAQRALEIRSGRLYRQGSVEGNTLDFVRYEQSIVQMHLDALRRRSAGGYRREIRAVNASLAALRCRVLRGFANRCFLSAADEALHRLGRPLDFAEQRCRILLGTQIAREATLDATRPLAGPAPAGPGSRRGRPA
jgi:hypothetical protein